MAGIHALTAKSKHSPRHACAARVDGHTVSKHKGTRAQGQSIVLHQREEASVVKGSADGESGTSNKQGGSEARRSPSQFEEASQLISRAWMMATRAAGEGADDWLDVQYA